MCLLQSPQTHWMPGKRGFSILSYFRLFIYLQLQILTPSVNSLAAFYDRSLYTQVVFLFCHVHREPPFYQVAILTSVHVPVWLRVRLVILKIDWHLFKLLCIHCNLDRESVLGTRQVLCNVGSPLNLKDLKWCKFKKKVIIFDNFGKFPFSKQS